MLKQWLVNCEWWSTNGLYLWDYWFMVTNSRLLIGLWWLFNRWLSLITFQQLGCWWLLLVYHKIWLFTWDLRWIHGKLMIRWFTPLEHILRWWIHDWLITNPDQFLITMVNYWEGSIEQLFEMMTCDYLWWLTVHGCQRFLVLVNHRGQLPKIASGNGIVWGYPPRFPVEAAQAAGSASRKILVTDTGSMTEQAYFT